MRDLRTRIGKAGAAGALATMALGLAPAASGAAEPSFTCEASALRATLLGQAAIEPSTTGRGAPCATGTALPPLALAPLLTGSVLSAETTFDPAALQAGAAGTVTGLHLGLDPGLLPAINLPTEQLIAALPPISVPIPAPLVTALHLVVPTFPSAIQVDIRDAVNAALPGGRLATGDLLGADLLRSTAAAGCTAGVPSLAGASNVNGLRALGQNVNVVDGVAQQQLMLLDSASIDLSTLDLSQVSVLTSLDGLTAPLLSALQALIGPALVALPPIEIPPTLAQLTVRAPEQIVDGDVLTQRALHATLTLAGQPILDAVAGEAKAGRAGACPPPPSPPPSDGPAAAQGVPAAPVVPKNATAAGLSASAQLLACTDRKLILLDVLPSGNKVRIKGAADRALVGRNVKIRLRATGKVVASAKVGKDGFFTTTAPLPPRAIRTSNAARYRAELGKELSLPLKLHRRMALTRLTSAGGKVTVAGRVELPLSHPADTIKLVRRVSCHKTVLVKSFRPASDGTFEVTVAAPKGAAAAVYRLATHVPKTRKNPKRFPTFTLPRASTSTSAEPPPPRPGAACGRRRGRWRGPRSPTTCCRSALRAPAARCRHQPARGRRAA